MTYTGKLQTIQAKDRDLMSGYNNADRLLIPLILYALASYKLTCLQY